jgi:hypothetical protein
MSMWASVWTAGTGTCREMEQLANEVPHVEPDKATDSGVFQSVRMLFGGKPKAAVVEAKPATVKLCEMVLVETRVQPAFPLGQAWDEISYLLTGTENGKPSKPIPTLLSLAVALKGTDAGYGPYLLITPEKLNIYAYTFRFFNREVFNKHWKSLSEGEFHVYGFEFYEKNPNATGEEADSLFEFVTDWIQFVTTTALANEGLLIGIK